MLEPLAKARLSKIGSWGGKELVVVRVILNRKQVEVNLQHTLNKLQLASDSSAKVLPQMLLQACVVERGIQEPVCPVQSPCGLLLQNRPAGFWLQASLQASLVGDSSRLRGPMLLARCCCSERLTEVTLS